MRPAPTHAAKARLDEALCRRKPGVGGLRSSPNIRCAQRRPGRPREWNARLAVTFGTGSKLVGRRDVPMQGDHQASNTPCEDAKSTPPDSPYPKRRERNSPSRRYRLDANNVELRHERYHSLADGRAPDRHYPALHVRVLTLRERPAPCPCETGHPIDLSHRNFPFREASGKQVGTMPFFACQSPSERRVL